MNTKKIDEKNIKNRIDRLVEYNKNGDPSVLEVANDKTGKTSPETDKRYATGKSKKDTPKQIKDNDKKSKDYIDKIKKEVEDEELEEDYAKEQKVGPSFM